MVNSGAYTPGTAACLSGALTAFWRNFNAKCPRSTNNCRQSLLQHGQPHYERSLERIWPVVRKETIDYGVMEGAARCGRDSSRYRLADVGSWASLLDVLPADDTRAIR